MKQYSYNQILCCSSEMSLNTGLPGFGVRAKSPGISPETAEEIYLKSGLRYSVPMDKMITAEKLCESPQLSLEYPHIYAYQPISLSDGTMRFIVARVMYAGADYGFFTNTGSNNRVGANYIAHILVFEEELPINIISELLLQQKFLPIDTKCSASNSEFTRILIGECYELPIGEISVGINKKSKYSPIQCRIILGMLQAFKNKKENNEICNIIVKINHAQVEDTIVALGVMPHSLTDGIFFNANVSGQSSVPDGRRMIVVNEKDDTETLDDYHIVINAQGEQCLMRNLYDNYLFDRILENSIEGDIKRINTIANLFVSLCEKQNLDYENAYQLITLASTDDVASLDVVETLDLGLIPQLQLSDSDVSVIWNKINDALNGAFNYPCKLKSVKSALRIISTIQRVSPQRLRNTDKFAKVLNHILFGTNEYFDKTIGNDKECLKVILSLLKNSRVELPTEENLLNSLNTSSNVDVWMAFLSYFYGDASSIATHMPAIIDGVMSSKNSQLIKELFPVGENFERWISVINIKPEYTSVVKDELCNVLCSRIMCHPQEEINEIFKLNREVMHSLDIKHIVGVYAETLENLKNIDFVAAENTYQGFAEMGVESNSLRRLLDIHNEKEVANPTNRDIQLASKLKTSRGYFFGLFKAWIQNNATKEEVAACVSNLASDVGSAAKLMDIVWAEMPMVNRTKTYLWIFDHLKSDKYKSKDLGKAIKDREACALLAKENTMFKKIIRKILGYRLIMFFFVAITLFASCDNNSNKINVEYFGPFQAEYYGDSTGLYKVVLSEYNKRGNLTNIYSRGYTSNGNLLFTTACNSGGGVDSIVCEYESDGKLVSIKEKGSAYHDFKYNTKHQLCQYLKSSIDKQDTEIYNFTYNPDNRISNIVVTDNNGTTVSQTEYIYKDGKLETTKTIAGNTLIENGFNIFDGTICSVKTYTYPRGRLQLVKNLLYGDVMSQGDSLYVQTVKINNSKGVYQGKVEKAVMTYNQYLSLQASQENINKAIVIDKPVMSDNIIENFINNIVYRVAINNAKTESPGMWLLGIVLVLTCLCAIVYYQSASKHALFQPFGGKPNANGMKRLWMFNSGPYINVTIYLLTIICAFVTSVLLLLAVGAITYGILWVIKILIIILIWIGWIALILGLATLILAKEGMGCLPIILGGIIVYFEDTMRAFGESIVNWGFSFMNKVNIFEWGINLFVDFWDIILSCFAIPMAIFLFIALTVILIVLLLTCIEWTIMKVYAVRRPCPVCGSTGDKEYWVDKMHRHPVKLQPGIYGVFSHTEPVTKTKLPTMLLAGKSRLLRKCPDCGSYISSDDNKSYGTEKHIGIVGHRSSGKSYLAYSLLNTIMKKFGMSAKQIDADRDTEIKSNILRISKDQGIQTDVRDSYRGIQLIIKPKLRPIPYHLFFYDVAGEKFNQSSSASKTAMDFYRNVNQIIFVVDPTSVDFTYTSLSDKMQDWLQVNGATEKYSIDGTFATLKSILESVGRRTKDIDFMFVLVKADKGYIEECGYNNTMVGDEIKTFLQKELGLTNILNAARGSFKKVEFELASVKKEYDAQLNNIIDKVLKNLGIL